MNLQQKIDQTPEGAVLRLPAGVHVGTLQIARSITLIGEPLRTILDGDGDGPVVSIDAPDAKVKLVGLVLQNGDAHAGGAVCFRRGDLELIDCVLRGSRAESFAGGALYAAGRTIRLERCQLLECRALQGGGALFDGLVKATLVSTLVATNRAKLGGGLRVREGAQVELEGCTVADNHSEQGGTQLDLAGTMSRRPVLRVRNSIVSGDGQVVFNRAEYAGELSGSHVLLPAGADVEGLEAVVLGDPGFRRSGSSPYALDASSPARERGDASEIPDDATDLGGHLRKQPDRAIDLGAYVIRG